MPAIEALKRIAQAYMQRERAKLGYNAEDRTAQAAGTDEIVKRAQLAQLAQKMGFAPAEHDADLAYKGAATDAARAGAEESRADAFARHQPKRATPGSMEDYMTADPARRAEIEKARKGYGQADDRAHVSVGITPTAESNILNRLVTQWDKAIAPARELSRQSKLMEAGLNAARRGDMAAGSQSVLVTFQKILDPTSVVRESEYARSASGQSLLNRISGAYEQLKVGGASVPLPELEKFAQLANEMVKASVGGHTDSVKARIGRAADRYNIPHDLVFDDFDYSGAQPQQGAQPAPAAGSGGAQTKIINGVPYVKVQGGWKRQ